MIDTNNKSVLYLEQRNDADFDLRLPKRMKEVMLQIAEKEGTTLAKITRNLYREYLMKQEHLAVN